MHDEDQRAAIQIATNAVVSAGAGSGKTSVLTNRYLRLVVEKRIPIGSILALTFTRKAAAEMYERIYRALLDHSSDPFVREQLASFDDAMIATLDSFCASIARNGCARFGVPPTFTVDEEALETTCNALSLSFLTEHAAEPVIADLIRLNGFAPLWRNGFSRLAIERFGVAADHRLVEYLAGQAEFLDAEIRRLAADIRAAALGIAGLDPEGPACIASAQRIVASLDLDAALSATPRNLEALSKISLRCGSSKHPDVTLFKEYVGTLRLLVERYLIAHQTRSRWPEHERLMQLLDAFRERIVAEKRRTGLLSYHDVVELAIRSLVLDPDLRAYYKHRYRAVMIDEFQDNNEEQKVLLYLVSERLDRDEPGIPRAPDLMPDKLFFVGDEKQSIYRFRGADVSVFRTLAGELSGADADLRLSANYRSEPGLIHGFNELFPRVFGGASHAWEARFEPLRAREATPGVTPRLEIWQIEQRPSGDETWLEDMDSEAFHIATFIRDAVENQALLVGAGVDEQGARRPGRPATYADFAILMRSTGNQIRFERTLRLFGIPYDSQTPRSLFLEAPVNDIYQVLQLVLYPTDRVAYAGYLRSPLVGLSDEGLVRQLLGDTALFEPCEGHDPDDLRRLSIAGERYDELCRMADAQPITELLHHIWYRWGYRYHLLRRPEHTPYLEYYDLFWELAHRFEDRGLAAFLDEARRHLGQNEKLDEIETIQAEASGVQIMTIHRAKGLEFPVVIVANAGNRGRNDTVSASPYHWSSERGPAFNTGVLAPGEVREKPANYLYACEADEAAEQELAEMKRLLYVAATRAESHLVFSGVPRDSERSLTGILLPAFNAALDTLSNLDELCVAVRECEPVPAYREREAQRSGGRRDIGELAAAYSSAAVVERTFPLIDRTATALNDEAVRTRVSEAGSTAAPPSMTIDSPPHPVDDVIARHDIATLFGTYCHTCIERADELGISRQPAPPPAEAPDVPPELRPDIPEHDLAVFSLAGYEFARRFLESPVAAQLEEAQSVEHELGFVLEGGQFTPGVVRGQIDLLAEFADYALVLDFKTDRTLNPESYRVQMEVYRRAAEALTGKPARVELVHLRSGETAAVGPVGSGGPESGPS